MGIDQLTFVKSCRQLGRWGILSLCVYKDLNAPFPSPKMISGNWAHHHVGRFEDDEGGVSSELEGQLLDGVRALTVQDLA